MSEHYSSTSILLELQGTSEFGLSLHCATCDHVSFVTLEPAEDGIKLSNLKRSSLPLSLSRYNPVVAVIGSGKLSILCGFCRSGKSVIQISLAPGGTSYSPEKSGSNEKETQ